MKKIKTTLLGLFITAVLSAQSIAPQSVNAAGTKMTQSNGSLSFTVGELVVLQQVDANGNSLGSGFTNASTISTTILAVEEPNAEILQVDVFPNPTSDLVQIRIKESKLEEMQLSVTDLKGRELFQGRYRVLQQSIGINTAAYPAGTYLLSLKDLSGKLLGTYKIVKR
jgi:hypothetical protein